MSWFPNLPHELAELFTQAVARAQDYSDELGSALRFNTEIDALSGKQPARPGVIHEFYLNNRELLQFGFERETSVPLVAPSISSNLMDYFDFTYLLVPQGDLLTQTDILTSNLAIRLTRLSMAEYAARDRNNPTIDRYLQGDTSPFIADRLHKWVNLLLAWLHHSNRRAGLLTAEQLQAVVKLESLATQTLAHVISIRSDVEELDWDSRGGRSSTFYSATVGWGSHQPDLREVRLYAQAAREARVEAMRSLGDPDPEMSLQALHDPDLYG